MRHTFLAFIPCLAFLPSATVAQVVPALPGISYLANVGDCSQGGVGFNNVTCVSAGRGIPLDYYALNSSTTSQFGGVNNQIAGINSQVVNLGNQIAMMNQQLRQTSAFATAMGAMQDAIPAQGDRFAFRLNTATANGLVAGGVGASANLNDKIRFSVNYAGTRGQDVFSGGLNISFN